MGTVKGTAVIMSVLLLVTALSGCLTEEEGEGAKEELERTFDASASTTVSVEVLNGDIEVKSWSEDEVRVDVVKRSQDGADLLKEVDVLFSEANDTIDVRTKVARQDLDVSVDVTVRVPSYAHVASLTSTNGRIVVEGTHGNLTVTTTNGDVTVRDVDGVVSVETQNGDVQVRDVTATGDLYSRNGDIRADVLDIVNHTQISTENGLIAVYINQNLDLDLVCFSGVSDIELHDLVVNDKAGEGKHLEGKVGAGGFNLDLTTTSGGIDIYKWT